MKIVDGIEVAVLIRLLSQSVLTPDACPSDSRQDSNIFDPFWGRVQNISKLSSLSTFHSEFAISLDGPEMFDVALWLDCTCDAL